MPEANPPLTPDEKRIHHLAETIIAVIGGCRNGTIKSQPIMIEDPEAETLPILTLEEYLTQRLAEVGVHITSIEPQARPRKQRKPKSATERSEIACRRQPEGGARRRSAMP